MKVSHCWLQKFFDADLPTADVVADALNLHAFEKEGVEKAGGDSIIDVNVTANRGHDCLSHRGIAKELSAILDIPFTHDPFAEKPDLSKKTDAVSVEIEDPNLCKRYIAGHIRGVKVGPSPKWLQERLESIGQKPINNIVDAANFVMFNTGQPLHAFDAEKLKRLETGGWKIQVRNAKKGEKIVTLDNKEYELSESMLLIVDGNADKPIGIAGVKGGMPARVTSETKDIIIESANFDGASVRKTAAALKLRSDASARFEQVISPELAAYGIRSVVDLILKIACPHTNPPYENNIDVRMSNAANLPPHQSQDWCGGLPRIGVGAGGELVGVVDQYPSPARTKEVSVTLEKINELLGVNLTAKDVENVFKRLGFSYKEARNEFKELTKAIVIGGILGAESSPTQSSGHFTVEAPFERLDLEIPEDLVEEVGRIIGYDKIPAAQLPPLPLSRKPEVNKNFHAAEQTREEWISKGYSEVYTSVFAEKGERVIANKIDGVRPYLRANLVDGLREAYEKNKRNAEFLGLKEVRLFEIGTVWRESEEKQMIGVADISGVREMEIRREESPRGQPAARRLLAADPLPLSKATRYRPFSRYPFIIRDVALWIVGELDVGELERQIRELAGALCIKVFLFDRFEKDNRVSLAYRLIFQSFDRTLTEEDVHPIMEKIYVALKEKGFEIR